MSVCTQLKSEPVRLLAMTCNSTWRHVRIRSEVESALDSIISVEVRGSFRWSHGLGHSWTKGASPLLSSTLERLQICDKYFIRGTDGRNHLLEVGCSHPLATRSFRGHDLHQFVCLVHFPQLQWIRQRALRRQMASPSWQGHVAAHASTYPQPHSPPTSHFATATPAAAYQETRF